ncbi:MAG TPA: SPOR domain-containing protein [Croceibacterium sp.]|jgi:rare lipoprotein A
MRLLGESFAGRVRGLALTLILVPALAACGSHHELASAGAGPAPVNGPAADYPIVIGSPYKVGETLYTPADRMNFDEVGYVAADSGRGVTASHHTLPLPSYADVTSLKSGHTILVRVERRGPMDGNEVIGLSPAALAQLGASAGDPVRVRRVNPPEAERAALRAGRSAPARMDTPASLVAVLKQKLPAEGAANLALQKPNAPATLASVEVPPSTATPRTSVMLANPEPRLARSGGSGPPPLPPLLPHASATVSSRPPGVVVARLEQQTPPADSQPVEARSSRTVPQAPRATQTAQNDAYVVQAAAMSTLERARKVAGSIGGSVSKAGQYFRVRTGPFATHEQAEASLAKVRAAGYSDARILTNG